MNATEQWVADFLAADHEQQLAIARQHYNVSERSARCLVEDHYGKIRQLERARLQIIRDIVHNVTVLVDAPIIVNMNEFTDKTVLMDIEVQALRGRLQSIRNKVEALR